MDYYQPTGTGVVFDWLFQLPEKPGAGPAELRKINGFFFNEGFFLR